MRKALYAVAIVSAVLVGLYALHPPQDTSDRPGLVFASKSSQASPAPSRRPQKPRPDPGTVDVVYVWPLNIVEGAQVVSPGNTGSHNASLLAAFDVMLRAAYPNATVVWTGNATVLETDLHARARAVALALPGPDCSRFPVPNMKHVALVTLADGSGDVGPASLQRATPDLVIKVNGVGLGKAFQWQVAVLPTAPGQVPAEVLRRVRAALDNRLQAMSDVEVIHSWPPSTERRYIVFSLFLPKSSEDSRGYLEGARINAVLAQKYFPGWVVRFYVDETTVLPHHVAVLNVTGTEEFVFRKPAAGTLPTMWRFTAMNDPAVDRFIVRDTDGRLNARDAFAVKAWIDSGKPLHMMHDTGDHRWIFWLSGLWGSIGGYIPSMTKEVDAWIARGQEDGKYGVDQNFLLGLYHDLKIPDDHVLFHQGKYGDHLSKEGKRLQQVQMPTQRRWNFEFCGDAVAPNVFEQYGKPAPLKSTCEWWIPEDAPVEHPEWLYS